MKNGHRVILKVGEPKEDDTMAEDPRMDVATLVRKSLDDEADPDILRSMVKAMAEALMVAEAQSACGAGYREVSLERSNSRNGYRTRRWDTRVGTSELASPKLRRARGWSSASRENTTPISASQMFNLRLRRLPLRVPPA